MINKVNVLVKGHIKLFDETYGCGWSTMILIYNGKNKIIVDPGTVKNQEIIHMAMQKEGLKVADITHVFITHSHLDHYRNLGMFPNAIALDYWGHWIRDKARLVSWPEKYDSFENNDFKDIQIIRTPGHDYSCITFFVKGETNFKGRKVNGVISICGDVFWKKDFPKLDEEPYATDKKLLKKSRGMVTKNSDYIIPWHYDIFKVE